MVPDPEVVQFLERAVREARIAWDRRLAAIELDKPAPGGVDSGGRLMAPLSGASACAWMQLARWRLDLVALERRLAAYKAGDPAALSWLGAFRNASDGPMVGFCLPIESGAPEGPSR